MKSLPRTLALLAFAVAMTVTAQKDSSMSPQGGDTTNQMKNGKWRMGNGGRGGVVSSILHSPFFILDSVTTNATADYRMPVAADYGSRWHLRGAYEDEARIDFGTWRFPWGSNDLASVWAQTFGTVCPTPRDRERMISAVGAPMSAVPGESRLWTLRTNDVFLITWEDFILGRQPKTAATPAPRVNAQIELRRNGWVVTRSNEVETVYRRVDPDDWDGDGLPNAADEWPCRNDGDFFGPRQTLPATADTNNYYWVDLVVHGVDALVTFTGDRASDLPDPVFMARAEATNRVTLLIGKEYAVTCARPLEIVARECADIEVTALAKRTVIRWPLVFSFVQVPVGGDVPDGGGDGPHLMSAGRQGTSIERTPSRTTGRYEWDGNYCCVTMVPILNSPLFVCDDHCGCGGCSTGQITYSSEGASFHLEFPIYCACPAGEVVGPAMPSAGGVAVAFSKPAVIFENDYTNSADAVVGRRSTRVELQCALNGGENGGDYEIGLQDGGRLVRVAGSPLPRTGTLAPHETFRFRIPYEGVMESAATNDIVATASFTDAVTHIQSQNVANLTAVRLVVTPEAYRENLENRHRMGVRERFQISPMPTNVLLDVSLDAGWRVTNTTKGVFYQCPIIAATTGVTVRVSDVPYIPELSVIEPAAVVGRDGRVEVDFGFLVGQAGGIITSYEVYVLPEDVSFGEISMMEVPTQTSQVSGYFTNSFCSAIWYHTTERGAGVWHPVRKRDNFFFPDVPKLGDVLPQPWYEGVLDWHIPIGWGEKDASMLEDVVKQLPTIYHQVFTIDGQGGVAVRKFGEWAKRMPDGTITHSPGLTYEGDGNANP